MGPRTSQRGRSSQPEWLKTATTLMKSRRHNEHHDVDRDDENHGWKQPAGQRRLGRIERE